MKTSLLTLTAFFCIVAVSPADAPKCQVIRIDSPAAREALRGRNFPTKLSSPVTIGILTKSGSNALLKKLDKDAKPIEAADTDFTVSTTAGDASPDSVRITFTYGGHSKVVSLFEHQSLVVATPDKRRSEGHSIYLLRLE